MRQQTGMTDACLAPPGKRAKMESPSDLALPRTPRLVTHSPQFVTESREVCPEVLGGSNLLVWL